jgi:hypothetical protein
MSYGTGDAPFSDLPSEAGGYRAPANAVISSMFVTSAALVAQSIYLVLDMDIPFSGIIRHIELSASTAPTIRSPVAGRGR